MSYDVYLLRFMNGIAVDTACEPALSILKAACKNADAEYFDEMGDVALIDGSSVELIAKDIASGGRFEGITFVIRAGGYSSLLIKLMFDLAQAGDFIVINSAGVNGDVSNPQFIIVDERQRRNLIPDWISTAVLCKTPQQLGRAIGGGFDQWHRWASQNDSI